LQVYRFDGDDLCFCLAVKHPSAGGVGWQQLCEIVNFACGAALAEGI